VLKGIATAADLRSTRGNEITWRVEDMDRKHFVAAQGFYRCASAVVHVVCCSSVIVPPLCSQRHERLQVAAYFRQQSRPAPHIAAHPQPAHAPQLAPGVQLAQASR
jgi:hypothetical protein